MKDLLITHVPQIKGLTVQEIIKEAKKHVEIQLYFQTWQKESSQIEILYEILVRG